MAHGEIIDIQPLPDSRREVTVSSSYTTVQRIVLAAGVLDTADGDEVLRRASDLRTVVYDTVRESAKDSKRRKG